ncbi:apoptotic chromatin condensation inducer in the nucleus-like isoform X2 [Euwallacea fornicatus]|uniref:apoptotic chromatin condensation inducer in the nucleus-like isoform X2 n=1 Tax=Euwallacea fornicatus TaxID=995702 RepID=UPI00338EF722
MVRKTTRAAALKASEKTRRELPRRSRRRKSSSKSQSSDDEVVAALIEKKVTELKQASSDSEFDKESKKPLKKRTRSSAVTNAKRKKADTALSGKKSEVKLPDADEVKDGNNAEGKSKCIDRAHSDNTCTETENRNIQVTDESPNHVSPTDELSKNGTEIKEIEVEESESVVAEVLCDTQSEVTIEVVPVSETTVEAISEETIIPANIIDVASTSTTEIRPQEENAESMDKLQSFEEPKKESKSKKIRLNRLTRASIKESLNEAEKEVEETAKKVTLKKPDVVKVEEPAQKEENHNSSPTKKETEKEEEPRSSSYESKNNKIVDDSKQTRKKITLKRRTTDEEPAKATINVSAGITPSVEREQLVKEDYVTVEKRIRMSTENSERENEEKLKKPTKPVKLKRRLSQTIEEPSRPISEDGSKKCKWKRSESLFLDTVQFHDIKEICPSVEFLEEAEVDLEITVKEKRSDKSRRLTFKELEDEEMENIEAELNAEQELEVDQNQSNQNVIAINRKISIVEDTGNKLNPPPSPAKNPVSEVLYITNLVRPFTVKQLKELLERTGKIEEDGFWTDKIKSKCFVCYETVGEAESTRNALHGVHWPVGNGKKLIIDYATREDMEKARNPPVAVLQNEKSPEKENKRPSQDVKEGGRRDSVSMKREWNVGKEEDRRKVSESTSVDREGRKHRSYTPEAQNTRFKVEEPVEQKAMDDLFLKTKATPSIYWQPLSPEEISRKQQQRQARLEENKRRLEEIRSSRPSIRDRRDRTFRRR